jgi:hypothetical protein
MINYDNERKRNGKHRIRDHPKRTSAYIKGPSPTKRRAWDIPLNFNQEVDDPETPTEALEGYFQEIIDFLEQEVN